MATRTTNYGLYKPDPTDDYVDFLSEFNDNMDEIDDHLGGGGSGGVKILRNQSLSFTGLVATVSDSDITADSNYIVYYHDVTLAENAGITTVASSGVITFTATTAPSNTIVVDIVLLDVNGGGGGSGGHNYSTSEQVIGTWIDGKPIYQRVITGLSIGQNTGTGYNIPIPSPDLELIIDSTLMSTLTPYKTMTHPPTWITNSSNLAIRSQEADTYDTFIIAYTKTTD